jgi:hypothetical protein
MKPSKALSLHLPADRRISALIGKIPGARRRATAAHERDHGKEAKNNSQPNLHPHRSREKIPDNAAILAKVRR